MKEFIWQIDINIIYMLGYILQTVIAVSISLMTYTLSNDDIVGRAYRKLNNRRINIINRIINGGDDNDARYNIIDSKLKRKGYKFYFNDMKPYKYVSYKIYTATAGAVIGLVLISVPGMIIGAIVGYYLIDFYTYFLDSRDNAAINDDIRIILTAMRVQGSVNIYITDILQECYYEINNKRLKKAMLEFTGDIRAKRDIEEAVDSFEEKFNNKYVESLCVAIKQHFRSGKSVNMIEYINKQMLALQREMIVRDRRVTDQDKIISNFIVFGIIIAFIFINVASVLNRDIF